MIGALHLDHLEVPDQDILMNILARLHFYRTQVNLGSDLWVRMSQTNKQTNYDTFVKLN